MLSRSMHPLLAVIALAIVASSQTVDLVGDPRNFIDTNSEDFQDVLSFVVQEHPYVEGWEVSHVTRQLVNGFNWRFTLTQDPHYAEVTVYQRFSGVKEITLWVTDYKEEPQAPTISPATQPVTQPPTQPATQPPTQQVKQPVTQLTSEPDTEPVIQPATQPATEPVVLPSVQPATSTSQPIILGGYTELTNPSGSEYEYVLGVLLAQHSDISEEDIVKVERQLVNGLNYRFTIQETDDSQRQIVVPVNFQDSVSPGGSKQVPPNPDPATDFVTTPDETSPPQSHTSTSISSNNGLQAVTLGLSQILLGAYQPVGDQSEIKLPVLAIHQVYTLYSLPYYQVMFAFEQVVSGKNYLIKLQHSSSPLDYAIFKVYVSLQNTITVTMLEQVFVSNYSLNAIKGAIERVRAQHTNLTDYKVVGVTNIWPGGKGIKLLFHKDDSKITVYVYNSDDGKEQILIR